LDYVIQDSAVEEIQRMTKISRHTTVLLLAILLATVVVGSHSMMSVEGQVELTKMNTLAQTYTNHDPIVVDGNADLLAQAVVETWSGDGTENDPVNISGYRITDINSECIKISNVDLYWVITGCMLEGAIDATGILMSNVTNGEISNNIIRERDIAISGVNGIFSCRITDNQMYDNAQNAIKVLNGMADCVISGNDVGPNGGNQFWITGGFNDSVISGNTVEGGQNGIRVNGCLRSSFTGNTMIATILEAIMLPLAVEATVTGNIVDSPVTNGIMLSGINHIIDSNIVDNCTGYGIYLASGDYASICENIVSNCTDYGLKLSVSTANTTVVENVFIDNNNDGCQVIDDGDDNEFCYNHFDDWVSPDADSDNIVDVAYSLDGETQNVDPYPLVDPDGSIPTPTTGPGGPIDLAIDPIMVIAAGAVIALVVVVVVLKKR
jgi:parallel beta-helix repeat protein